MSRAPRLKGKEIARALERASSRIDRIRGSHVLLEHPDGKATSVPIHSREIIGPGLFRAILRDVEMTLEEFIELL
jgi:predicted RNA binding protein YcfA (HicA-like mRNA interferase family)